MQLTIGYIGARASARDEAGVLTQGYVQRASVFIPCEATCFRTESELMAWLDHKPGRIAPVAVLLDSRGRQMSSEVFASWIGTRRDEGARHILFAIGPADGWSETARKRTQLLLSLGPMTLAHSLARLVLAEQIYRACTILVGHPYHTGH